MRSASPGRSIIAQCGSEFFLFCKVGMPIQAIRCFYCSVIRVVRILPSKIDMMEFEFRDRVPKRPMLSSGSGTKFEHIAKHSETSASTGNSFSVRSADSMESGFAL